jgi:hypothetical protein
VPAADYLVVTICYLIKGSIGYASAILISLPIHSSFCYAYGISFSVLLEVLLELQLGFSFMILELRYNVPAAIFISSH